MSCFNTRVRADGCDKRVVRSRQVGSSNAATNCEKIDSNRLPSIHPSIRPAAMRNVASDAIWNERIVALGLRADLARLERYLGSRPASMTPKQWYIHLQGHMIQRGVGVAEMLFDYVDDSLEPPVTVSVGNLIESAISISISLCRYRSTRP